MISSILALGTDLCIVPVEMQSHVFVMFQHTNGFSALSHQIQSLPLALYPCSLDPISQSSNPPIWHQSISFQNPTTKKEKFIKKIHLTSLKIPLSILYYHHSDTHPILYFTIHHDNIYIYIYIILETSYIPVSHTKANPQHHPSPTTTLYGCTTHPPQAITKSGQPCTFLDLLKYKLINLVIQPSDYLDKLFRSRLIQLNHIM